MPLATNNPSVEMKWRLMLWPLSVLYDGVTKFRNHLFNIGQKPSFHFEIPVISVGNLNAGGSGKTPMIEYLIRLLGSKYNIATLSRGYGRTTRGIRFATVADNAASVGDEPYQFLRKFGDKVKVVVGEERALAIPTLMNEFPLVDLVLLDDAFQHRTIAPHFSILLTEYNDLFTRDHVLPAGNLREARVGARRADVVIVTKCPEAVSDEVNIVASIRRYAGDKPVFFSTVQYGAPVQFGSSQHLGKDIVVVTGIAHPQPFMRHVSDNFKVLHHFEFGDHHRYTQGELDQIHRYASSHNAVVMTTEKDMVRLIAKGSLSGGWFFIPIETVFLKNGSEFDQ